MDSSASSKVTVEYHDPAGVFPLVAPAIAARLPLRNLHWQSPSRPLRQIKSLHLDFLPDDATAAGLRPPTARPESEGADSFDIVRSQAGQARRDGGGGGGGRRHQIPGLQTTPYLRIYVLRCDDKDAYKSGERARIRQWLRDHPAPSSSGKKNVGQNENHTASEYLILHVVVPDTLAASEPRWRESQREPDELKERKPGAQWPGKSTRTVFDKLRADFNDSSKVDRVAQLRLTKDHVPPDLLPTPARASTYHETAEEQGKTWNDLLTKLKSLILIPFDKRVRQYEHDIAEQESRRSMPGFNFCTFFIHKEGLARALEAIGLVEDALVMYDELSLGLESVLRDLASGQAEGTATTFSPYTQDVKERILGAGKATANGTADDRGHSRDDSETVESGEIDYRERIVRSNISVFDFHCYLFSRRKALILRLANAAMARKQLGAHTKEGGEDLVLISEVCWRASNFLHNTARVLRQDLLAAKAAGKHDLSGADVDALVCSWLYTAAGRILDETAASALERKAEHGSETMLKSPPNGLVISPRRSEFADLGQAYPQRTTSLPARRSRVSELQSERSSMHSQSEEALVSPPSSSGTDGTKTASQLPGLLELVAYRAELVTMRRKMLEQLAAQRGWLAGWASLRAKRTEMETVDLNGSTERLSDPRDDHEPEKPSELLAPALISSLLSQEIFQESYDRLSDEAMRYYHSATQTKSAEAIVGDLAILKFQQGDYEFAAKYFEHVLPSYREEGWAVMEIEAMHVLKKCFEELGRKNEEVGMVLEMVKKRVAGARDGFAVDVQLEDGGDLNEAVKLSAGLEKEVAAPATEFFQDIVLEGEVIHSDNRDGFALELRLRHDLDEDLKVDEVIARLVHLDDPNQELCPMTSQPFTLRRGRCEVRLESNVTAFGPYLIDSVILKARNVYFTHDFRPTSEPQIASLVGDDEQSTSTSAAKLPDRPWVFVYPAQHAFNAEVNLAREVHIDSPRRLEIKLSSGWNDIKGLDLRLKPASAGLRLHLADAQLGGLQQRDGEAKPGTLLLGPLATQREALVTVPYSLDHPTPQEIIVHLTAQYRTATQEKANTFLTTIRLPAELPLDVDVNDVFHDDTLFSNFTVRATSKLPLVISSAELKASPVYDVEAPPAAGRQAMTVFEKFPAHLAYKITRRWAEEKVAKKDSALALGVTYLIVDELITQTMKEAFAIALRESPFATFRRLLVPLVVLRTKQLITGGEVETATLLGEARVPGFEAMGWTEVVNALPAVIRFELIAWLKKWHDDHRCLPLHLKNLAEQQQRSITISVEVPTMDAVHKATLSVLHPTHELDGDQVLALGEPVDAELVVSSTTEWSSDSVFGSGGSTKREEHFIYDIHADPETWLIGGPRRGHLTAFNGSTSTFSVTLLPLKLGTLPLPQIEIQPARLSSTTAGEGGGNEGEIRCETHVASAGQVVKVVRAQRGTRVVIPEPSGGNVQTRESVASTTTAAVRPPSRPGTSTETVRDVG